MTHKVFISYSSVDEKWAKRIASTLCNIKVDYFLDRKDIEWGDDVSERISEGLAQCSALIVVVSPASLRSHWVPFEIGQAKALGKRILPFLTHPSLETPAYLQQFHYKSRLADIQACLKTLLIHEARTKFSLKQEYGLAASVEQYGFRVIDISGLWKYRCTALGKEFDHGGFEHGGIVTIQQTRENFGISVRLSGERHWVLFKDDTGNVKLTKLSIPIMWGAANGSFTSDASIQFWYQLKDAHGIREGTTFGEIEIRRRRAVAIHGNFYYYDDSRMHGNIEMRRIKNKQDYEWPYRGDAV